MCPMVIAVTQLYVWRSSLGTLAFVGEVRPFVELEDVASFVRLLPAVGRPVLIAVVYGSGLHWSFMLLRHAVVHSCAEHQEWNRYSNHMHLIGTPHNSHES
jgi:hypothetical protein